MVFLINEMSGNGLVFTETEVIFIKTENEMEPEFTIILLKTLK